mmetsp:Transcript_59253/g.109510  ORF Transcript_59253/g.109510 Transcript_59253/m.109510 type:complete len:91 (+) Transcript_59253:246-518(+)
MRPTMPIAARIKFPHEVESREAQLRSRWRDKKFRDHPSILSGDQHPSGLQERSRKTTSICMQALAVGSIVSCLLVSWAVHGGQLMVLSHA